MEAIKRILSLAALLSIVLVANAQWMGAADADGLAELAFNI
jgi:hypothetical protein